MMTNRTRQTAVLGTVLLAAVSVGAIAKNHPHSSGVEPQPQADGKVPPQKPPRGLQQHPERADAGKE